MLEEKKECPIDQTKLTVFNQYELQDDTICRGCAKKLGLIGIHQSARLAHAAEALVTVNAAKEYINSNKKIDCKKLKLIYTEVVSTGEAPTGWEMLKSKINEAEANSQIDTINKTTDLNSTSISDYKQIFHDDQADKYPLFQLDFKRDKYLILGKNKHVGDFSEINKYEAIEHHSEVEKHHRVSRAIIGHHVAKKADKRLGDIGAVIGACTGGSSYDQISKLAVLISFKDGTIHEVALINFPTKASGYAYEEAQRLKVMLCTQLDSIISSPTNKTKPTGDQYDNLKKLKSLVDADIITQQEFEAAKKKLLGI